MPATGAILGIVLLATCPPPCVLGMTVLAALVGWKLHLLQGALWMYLWTAASLAGRGCTPRVCFVCVWGAGSGKGVGTLWGEGDGEVVSLGDRGHVLQILAAAQCRLICCTLLRYVACKMIMRKHVGAAPTSTAHELLLLTPSLCSCLVPPKPCIHSDLLHVLQRGVGVASHG